MDCQDSRAGKGRGNAILRRDRMSERRWNRGRNRMIWYVQGIKSLLLKIVPSCRASSWGSELPSWNTCGWTGYIMELVILIGWNHKQCPPSGQSISVFYLSSFLQINDSALSNLGKTTPSLKINSIKKIKWCNQCKALSTSPGPEILLSRKLFLSSSGHCPYPRAVLWRKLNGGGGGNSSQLSPLPPCSLPLLIFCLLPAGGATSFRYSDLTLSSVLLSLGNTNPKID